MKLFSALGDVQRKLLFAILALFLTFSCFHIHGFSIPIWDGIEGEPSNHVLIGTVQDIRSDDWLAWIPATLSQHHQTPSFPTESLLLGAGTTKVFAVPAPIPSRHFSILFRPQLWGYFLGDEFGLAWHWNFHVFGLLALFFVLFTLISNGDIPTSLAGAILALASPFFQFWSYNGAPMVLFGCGCLISALAWFYSENWSAALFSAFGFFYLSCGFAFGIYPPYQIAIIYFTLFLFGGITLATGLPKPNPRLWRLKLGFALVGLILISVVMLKFISEASDVFQIMQSTVYPGHRFAIGGTLTVEQMFSNLTLIFLDHRSWLQFRNVCEVASFYFLFPPIAALMIFQWHKKLRQLSILDFSLFMVISLFICWEFFGLPEGLATLSFLRMIPEERSWLAPGLANACLIIRYIATSPANLKKNSRWPIWVVLVLWGVFIFFIGHRIAPTVPSSPKVEIYTLCGISWMLSSWFLFSPKTGIRVFACLFLASTFLFNPIVHGGLSEFSHGHLIKAIERIETTYKYDSDQSYWMTFGDIYDGNFLRMTGHKSISGVYFYPKMDLWRELDPTGHYLNMYNRYAHVTFEVSDRKSLTEISNPSLDIVRVRIHPDNPLLKKLNVNYIVSYDGPNDLAASRCFHSVYKYQKRTLYVRVPCIP